MSWWKRRSALAKHLRHLCGGAGLSTRWGKDWPAVLEDSPRWPTWSRLRERLDALFGKLEDDASRDILARLLVHQLLGPEGFPLPVPGGGGPLPEWSATEGELVPSGFRDLVLTEYDLAKAGYPLRVLLGSERPNTVYDLEQYANRDQGVFVRAGDVVIDGGGCWGDSALYFADKAGPEGRVFSFEFLPSNLTILRRNLDRNSAHAPRVKVVEKALWSDSATRFSVVEDGPATRVQALPAEASPGGEVLIVSGTSLDDFAKEQDVAIDFIKLDVEGAEPKVLEGAVGILRRDRPDLAVCVYHDPEHYVLLAEFLENLGLGYRFSLRHFTDCAWETVLFARTEQRPAKQRS